jgi:multisubunit Na+/H+ antiporter MnhE subunit
MLTLELLAWELVCVAVWMASLSAWSPHELVVAVAASVPAAVAGAGARRAVRGAWRLPSQTLRWAALVPLAVVADAGRVLSLPFRRGETGEWRTLRLGPAAVGDGPAATGHRAMATTALSLSPGSYVVAVDEEAGTALVHAVSRPSRLEQLLSGGSR